MPLRARLASMVCGNTSSGGRPAGRPLCFCLTIVGLLCVQPPDAARADHTVVVAGPTSGPRAAETEAIRAAVQAATDMINTGGGVLGEPINVVLADDGCDAARAREAARSIILTQPRLVIGHACSSAAIAAAREYGAAHILMITPGARHRDLTSNRAGPTIFRLA